MRETIFEYLRNKAFHEMLLVGDIKQNKNDYLHRNRYDKFSYHFINSESGRKKYCQKFIYLSE
jgi:hypothetical protein